MEPGELVHHCLRTEFTEEALGSLMDDPRQKEEIKQKLDILFADGGVEVGIIYLD